MSRRLAASRGVAWRGVARRGVARRGAAWRGVAWLPIVVNVANVVGMHSDGARPVTVTYRPAARPSLKMLEEKIGEPRPAF